MLFGDEYTQGQADVIRRSNEQTMKVAQKASADYHRREEWEYPLFDIIVKSLLAGAIWGRIRNRKAQQG